MKRVLLIAIFILIFLLAGCQPKERRKSKQYPLFWPEPPAPPMLVYNGIFRGGADITSKAIGLIAGKVEMRKPYGIAESEKGDLYVTDLFHKIVFKFERENKKTDFFGQGILRTPLGVACYRDEVFVVDSTLNEVLVFKDGSLVRRFGSKILKRPTGIAIGVNGKIYVTSTLSHSVHVFSMKGDYLFNFGKKGEKEGEFFLPSDIEVVGNRLYVVDSGNRRVEVFDVDGKFVKVFGLGVIAHDLIGRPKGIALDSDGNLYLTDTLKHRFYAFDRNARLLFKVGKKGRGRARFQVPGDIFIDKKGFVFVADQMNGRVQVFKRIVVD